MLDVSDTIKDIYRNRMDETADIQHVLTFTTPSLTITNTNIPLDNPPVLTENLCSTRNLTVGSCEAACLELTVADVTADIAGKEFTYTHVLNAEHTVDMGKFIVSSIVEQSDKRFKTITAYDRMIKFDIDVKTWWDGLTYPITINALYASLCAFVGVSALSQTLANGTVSIAS